MMSPIEPKNLLRHEIIGLEVRVVKSSQPSYIGIKGKVVDETKNTLTIHHMQRDKTIAKKTATFHFKLPSGLTVEVEGKNLVKRPEDRVKTRSRKLW